MTNQIFYVKYSITELEVRYTTDAVTNCRRDRCYDYTHCFEAAFRKHLEVHTPLLWSSR